MAKTLEIRLAVSADVAPIAIMSRDLIEIGLGWSWTPDRVARNLARKDTVGIVAYVAWSMAGFAIMRYGYEEANLDLLAVRSDCRRVGVGRGLVQWLEETARVAGVGIVRVQVRADRPAAQDFYRSLGYRVYGRLAGYYRRRQAAVCMAHDLWCAPNHDDAPSPSDRP